MLNKKIVENVIPPLTNVSHRKFNDLNDLIIYIQSFQKKYNIPNGAEYGSVYGIMTQFLCYNITPKDRNKDEVFIKFCEEEILEETKDIKEPKIDVNFLWFDKKTRRVLLEPPKWAIESKQKVLLSCN